MAVLPARVCRCSHVEKVELEAKLTWCNDSFRMIYELNHVRVQPTKRPDFYISIIDEAKGLGSAENYEHYVLGKLSSYYAQKASSPRCYVKANIAAKQGENQSPISPIAAHLFHKLRHATIALPCCYMTRLLQRYSISDGPSSPSWR